MSVLDSEKRAEIEEILELVVDTVAPAVLKAIAASRPGVSMVGELMHTEPARDYPKELWIATYVAMRNHLASHKTATECANIAAAEFKETFK